MVKTHPKSRLVLLTVEQIRDTNEVVLQAEKTGSQFVGSMKDAYLCEVVSQHDFRNAATIETVTAALLEERAGHPLVWYHCTEGDPSLPCDPADETECFQYGHEDACQYRNKKPEGAAVELADAVIRIADLCGHLGIDLDAVIEEKMAYNADRPYKHGKRF